MRRYVLVAYVFFAIGSPIGLHLIYVDRLNQAVAWTLTFGGFGLGLLRDLWMLPRYVREANDGEDLEKLMQKRRRVSNADGRPPWTVSRFLLQFALSCMLGVAFSCLVPPAEDGEVLDESLQLLGAVLGAIGTSLGAWLGANVGNQTVDIKPLVFVSMFVAIASWMTNTEGNMVLFGLMLSALATGYREWRPIDRKHGELWPVWTMFKYWLVITLLLGVICVGTYNHGTIKVTPNENTDPEAIIMNRKGEPKVRVRVKNLFQDVFNDINLEWNDFERAWEQFVSIHIGRVFHV